VHKSKNAQFPEGTIVLAMLDWAEYTFFNGAAAAAGGAEIIENKYNFPRSAYLGVTAFTAYGFILFRGG
jgi:NADPH-dependent curcumin reductase CurA